MAPIQEFDVPALYEALDAKRLELGLSWSGVADAIWELSHELNAQRNDHPISPSTLSGLRSRRATSCQHALFMLRWLGRSPESFLVGADEDTPGAALPPAGPDRRLRWSLKRLYEAIDGAWRAQTLTWAQLAVELRCTPSQLQGLRTARFTTGMGLAMRIVQWLGRPAADFIDVTRW